MSNKTSEYILESGGFALKKQEIPYGHPDSQNFFDPTLKLFVATRNALIEFQHQQILIALAILFREAIKHNGLDYLQVFKHESGKILWFIEDPQVITALLPEDY